MARDRVVVADADAADAGVAVGMRLASAWGLMPTLAVYERDVAAEVRTLDALACWAGGLGPLVCLSPPDTVLIEIGGCLRLFGGLARLLETALQGCTTQGFVPRLAVAPTPLAAEWLARVASGAVCEKMEDLSGALAGLDLGALRPDARQAKLFAAWGLRTLGDLLCQPRAGLSRRLGAAFSLQLAQALGEVPDPRRAFEFPETFVQRLELPAPVTEAQALVFASQRLLGALSGWLAARNAGMRQCQLELEHREGPSTVLEIGFAEPVHALVRISRVVRERLERHVLRAPVEMLHLRVDTAEPLAGASLPLFGESGQTASVAEVVERLRARLGNDAVHGLCTVADYRPENASKFAPLGAAEAPLPLWPRPCWLLPQARALSEAAGGPVGQGGPLQLLGSAERIESGWWDEGEAGARGAMRRDYFVALAPSGQLLWIYRDAAGWWQHGLFG